VAGALTGWPRMNLKIGETIVAAKGEIITEKHQASRVSHRLAENGEIQPLMRERNASQPKTKAMTAGTHTTAATANQKVRERDPVAREPPVAGYFAGNSRKTMKIGNVRFVLTQFPDVQHEVHPERISAQRKEEALAKTQQAGVAPKQIYAERQHRETKVFANRR